MTSSKIGMIVGFVILIVIGVVIYMMMNKSDSTLYGIDGDYKLYKTESITPANWKNLSIPSGTILSITRYDNGFIAITPTSSVYRSTLITGPWEELINAKLMKNIIQLDNKYFLAVKKNGDIYKSSTIDVINTGWVLLISNQSLQSIIQNGSSFLAIGSDKKLYKTESINSPIVWEPIQSTIDNFLSIIKYGSSLLAIGNDNKIYKTESINSPIDWTPIQTTSNNDKFISITT